MTDPAMIDPQADLLDDLPQGSAPPVDTGTLASEVVPPAAPRKALSVADRLAIAQHIDSVIEAGAAAGADTMPPELRDRYEAAFTTSRMVRGAVTATGIGHALHELMPASGPDGVGDMPAPMQRLHPVARILLGVAVLGIATLVQRRVVLNSASHTGGLNPGGPAGPAGGSHNVPLNTGHFGGHHQH